MKGSYLKIKQRYYGCHICVVKALRTCSVLLFGRINLGRHINQVVGWTGSPVPHYYVDP